MDRARSGWALPVKTLSSWYTYLLPAHQLLPTRAFRPRRGPGRAPSREGPRPAPELRRLSGRHSIYSIPAPAARPPVDAFHGRRRKGVQFARGLSVITSFYRSPDGGVGRDLAPEEM